MFFLTEHGMNLQIVRMTSRLVSYVLCVIQTLRRTVENIKDPLYRFFEREVAAGAALLAQVHNDLRSVLAICEVLSPQLFSHGFRAFLFIYRAKWL